MHCSKNDDLFDRPCQQVDDCALRNSSLALKIIVEWSGKLLCDVHVLGFLNEQNADYHGRECDNDREPQAENFLYFLQRSRSIRGRPSYAPITWLAQEVFPDTPSLGSLRLWRDAEASRTLVALPKLPHGRVRRLDMPAKPVGVEQ